MQRFLLCGLSMLLIAAVGPSPSGREGWFRIQAPDGLTIGWQHETQRPDDGGQIETLERQLSYSVDGHVPVRQFLKRVTIRDTAGRPVKQSLMIGAQPNKVRSLSSGHSTDLVSLLAILDTADGKPTAADIRASHASDGKIIVARFKGDQFAAAWFVDEAGGKSPRTVVQPQLGASMTFVTSDVPLGAADLSPRSRMPHPMVPSPYVITRAARAGHLRFQFELPTGLTLTVPQTGEQRVRVDAGSLTLDICQKCGLQRPTDPASLKQWSLPNAWLQSSAPELQRAVKSVMRPGQTQMQTMKRLGEVARTRLSGVDYDGHYSARDAWKRRKGDCTEDAVLLAALARAAGIPARVASGLVYDRERFHGARDAFLPHSWTLAWIDGRWRSFDISIGTFDATHIALSLGDGEPEAILSGWQIGALLKWRDMAEIRPSTPARQ
ncbi:MAG: transglutaminase-like domain-containing protein [Sphingomonadaceae bacterium]